MKGMFFSGWESLLRTLVVGVLAYVAIVVFLRISGRRTLSKMNAFDFVVTVALGSTLASVLLTKDIALADGTLAFALLIGLQFAVTWSSVRARWVRQLVTGEPLMLLYRGEFLSAALRDARVTEDEVRAAVRSSGLESLAKVHAVVLFAVRLVATIADTIVVTRTAKRAIGLDEEDKVADSGERGDVADRPGGAR